MAIITGILAEIWKLLVEMAPYLLLGFGVAGVLHIFLPKEKVARHLADDNIKAVSKAALLGVPLPLCSCGVIPVAAHLEKQGANRGPILSFLISTPTTGADSILATYALLGPLLAIARPIAAFFSGLLAGGISNVLDKEARPAMLKEEVCAVPPNETIQAKPSLAERVREVLEYAFVDLIADVSKWLVIGIIAGGIISYALPTTVIEQFLGNPVAAYTAMLLIGIPLYVCATGSIPIAASLIMKGLSPGAGFVFLFAGPATNTATLSFVGGKMGRKSLAIYLITILISSIAFGWIIDLIWAMSGSQISWVTGHMEMLPAWLHTGSAVLLLGMMAYPLTKKKAKLEGKGMLLKIVDMTCDHCRKSIDTALRKVEGVNDVRIDLETKQVEVLGNVENFQVLAAIEQAGYHVAENEG